jgi:pimeloyl-ACP methyl ester carboxylesterase
MPARILARLAVALAATALIVVSLLQLEAASLGLRIETRQLGSIPVTSFDLQREAGAAPRPVVVIAHGFAGSQQLMLPFALTLARAGYLVLTFDFPGHGRNRIPMAGGVADFAASTRALLGALDEVAMAARRWPGADGNVLLLGHSMASDIVVRRAMADEAVRASVVLSAYSPVVTAESPRNLLIVDGAWEPAMLHEEGLRIVGLALGGAAAVEARTYGDFAAGSARRFVLADGVEHISILYSREALREALDWFGRSLGPAAPPAGPSFLDARGRWLALLYLGLVALAWPLASLLPRATAVVLPMRATGPAGRAMPLPLGWRGFWPVALLPALLTPLLLWQLPGGFLPILLGDYLMLHFALYGLLTAVGLWFAKQRASPFPGVRPLALALATVAAAVYGVFAIGLPLDRYVTSFAPVGIRAVLVVAVFCGALPYFLADEWLVRGVSRVRGAYAFTKLMFLLSLAFAIALNPERLFFLAIVVPAILVAFVIYGLFSRWLFRSIGHPWAAAIANAAAFAWLIAVTFPVVAP